MSISKVLISFTLLASSAFAGTFLCTNRSSFNGPVVFKMNAKTGALTYNKTACSLSKIAYNPNSPKYEGWIRMGAGNTKGCLNFGTALHGGSSSKEKIDFYWVSISKEMQAGEDGFAQFGYQNIWDPGAGGTAKLFVRCRASN